MSTSRQQLRASGAPNPLCIDGKVKFGLFGVNAGNGSAKITIEGRNQVTWPTCLAIAGAADGHGYIQHMADRHCRGIDRAGIGITSPIPPEPFIGQLRDPSNEMPPCAATVLSVRDAGAVYAYSQTLPAPRAAKDILLLNN